MSSKKKAKGASTHSSIHCSKERRLEEETTETPPEVREPSEHGSSAGALFILDRWVPIPASLPALQSVSSLQPLPASRASVAAVNCF